MALKSTIYKAALQVSDMDRGYYAEHALILARHPSENDERLMVRVLAFAMYASPGLAFGRGLSTEDEADLYATDDTGAIRLWLDVGLPDERLVRKAASRAERVAVVSYGRTAEQWWLQSRTAFERIDKLDVVRLSPDDTQALAAAAQRSMAIQCTVQDGALWFSVGDTVLQPHWQVIKRGA